MTVSKTWTDPSEGGTIDRDTGQTLRESDWDAILSNLLMIGGTTGEIAANAYHSVAQSIATATWTIVALNSERYDTDTIHDLVTNNSRLTCKTAGKYMITASVEFAANATGNRLLELRLNTGGVAQGGTILAADYRSNMGAGVVTRLSVSRQFSMAVNDYVELNVYQDSGGALNLNATGSLSPELTMAKV
jgi:hypothetical protein